MKHFYLAGENNQSDLMVQLMAKPDWFVPAEVNGVSILRVPRPELPKLTQMTLMAMVSANTLDLKSAAVYRCGPGSTLPLGADGIAFMLNAKDGVTLAAVNEAVFVKNNEVWQVVNTNNTGMLINKSADDDVFMLFVALGF